MEIPELQTGDIVECHDRDSPLSRLHYVFEVDKWGVRLGEVLDDRPGYNLGGGCWTYKQLTEDFSEIRVIGRIKDRLDRLAERVERVKSRGTGTGKAPIIS